MQKKKSRDVGGAGGRVRSGRGGAGAQRGCEPRIEGIVNCEKSRGPLGGSRRCEARIEVIVKIQRYGIVRSGGGSG